MTISSYGEQLVTKLLLPVPTTVPFKIQKHQLSNWWTVGLTILFLNMVFEQLIDPGVC